LLDLGADIEQRDKYGLTPLHTAALSGRLEAARKLIARGADMATRFEQYSPIHTAAMNGIQDVVALLLDSGVPMDDPSAYGSTALHIAAENGHIELVRMLLSRGAELDVRERRHATP
ncbi:ankyrin repeat protein, partial [Schizophyllum commune H4-8]|uniref:ankyrin repeat protein n=1 Tax=Schizophyllum commune (strain H4-8 / FGSC 9210) TaxID=578458 RepID=UPI00215F8975